MAVPVRGSRIRRDPPPVVSDPRDLETRDERTVVIGVVEFGLAIVIITIGFSSFYGWSPSQYTLTLKK